MLHRRQCAWVLALVLSAVMLASGGTSAVSQTPPQQQQPAPGQKSATPKPDNDTVLQDDEVLRVETDLTNLLFTAVDKNKRFITTLRQDDIRVFEDGNPQEVFAFQRETDRA